MISFNCHIYIANTSQPDASFLFFFLFLLDRWPCSDSGFSAVPVSFLVALFGIRQLAAGVRQPATNQSWAWKTNEALFGTGRNSPAADIWSFQLQSGFCMCRTSPASNLKVNTELGTWKNYFVWNLIRRSSLVLDGTNCRFWKIVVGVVKHLRECRNYLSFKYFFVCFDDLINHGRFVYGWSQESKGIFQRGHLTDIAIDQIHGQFRGSMLSAPVLASLFSQTFLAIKPQTLYFRALHVSASSPDHMLQTAWTCWPGPSVLKNLFWYGIFRYGISLIFFFFIGDSCPFLLGRLIPNACQAQIRSGRSSSFDWKCWPTWKHFGRMNWWKLFLTFDQSFAI